MLTERLIKGEYVFDRCSRLDIDLDSIQKIGLDLAAHLLRLYHLDRPTWAVQAEGLAERIDDADMHPGLEACAQIKRNTVWLLMG